MKAFILSPVLFKNQTWGIFQRCWQALQLTHKRSLAESTHSGEGRKTPQPTNSPSATTRSPFHRVTRWMHQTSWKSSPGTTRNLDHGLTTGIKASNCKSPPLQMWNITISDTLLELFRAELPKHFLLLFPSNAHQTWPLARAHIPPCATGHSCTTA